jgi:peptidylprolyl isomerase
MVVAFLVAAGCVVYFQRPPAGPQSWFALGQAVEVSSQHQDAGLLTGPVAGLTTMCTADLGSAQASQRPAATDPAAVSQWLQGCAAGYHQQHPGQLIEDGTMYGNGAQPCTGTCKSKWTAAGDSIALSASKLPGFNRAGSTAAAAAATWCADLMFNRLSQPLTATVESQLQANKPAAGPETDDWDHGCEAGYSSALNPVQSNSAVTVTGPFGAAPQVTIPPQRAARSLYVQTLIQGDGSTMTSSDGLIANYVAYDWSGETHKLLGSSYSAGTPSLFVGKLLPGLEKALVGRRAGSRVLAVIPPADGFGTAGNSKQGIGATDTLVFVVDMSSTFSTAAVPGTQARSAGGALPTVTPPGPGSTAGPALTIPSQVTPPGTLQVKTLIKGSGAVVKKGDDIAVQYTGAIWRTGRVFQSSWAQNLPFTTPIGEGQVIAGWDVGLVGQTVSSRVLLVIPPADAYGSAGSAKVGIKGGDTLAFVVDILAAA